MEKLLDLIRNGIIVMTVVFAVYEVYNLFAFFLKSRKSLDYTIYIDRLTSGFLPSILLIVATTMLYLKIVLKGENNSFNVLNVQSSICCGVMLITGMLNFILKKYNKYIANKIAYLFC